LARQGEDTLWTVPAIGVGRLSDIAARDVQGDGLPELIAGNRIYSRLGQLLWDGMSAPSLSLDLADEGYADSIAVADSCVEVWSGQREILWTNSSCAKTGSASTLAAISRQAAGCSDVSVSAPKALLAGNGFSVRVANAGSVDVPAGLAVHLARAGTLQATSVTSRILRPGEWEDVSLTLGQVPAGSNWTAWTDPAEIVNLGILDSHTSNNSVKWGN
jgi:hypothetical protein